jgi:zinc-ribbon domain
MSEPSQINPNQESKRAIFRVFGIGSVITGLIFLVIGVVSFFSSFGTFAPPQHFWCIFLGIPLLGVGAILCQFGFYGALARYFMGEAAPVVRDTFNYMAEGTQPGIRTVSRAAGEGLARGISEGLAGSGQAPCPHCRHANAREARFCSQCGAALATAPDSRGE